MDDLAIICIVFAIGLFVGYCLAHIAIAIDRPNAGTLEIDKSKPTKDRYCFKFAIPLGDLEKMKHVQLTVKSIDASEFE